MRTGNLKRYISMKNNQETEKELVVFKKQYEKLLKKFPNVFIGSNISGDIVACITSNVSHRIILPSSVSENN